MTAYELLEQIGDDVPVEVATGTGHKTPMSSGDLRIMMGRWWGMDDTTIRLESEHLGSEWVAYQAHGDDWLFSVKSADVLYTPPPPGLRKKVGVDLEGGCGDPACAMCYEPD